MARRRRGYPHVPIEVEDEPEAVPAPEPEVSPLTRLSAGTCRHKRFRAIRDKTPWVWRCVACGFEWPMLPMGRR